MPRTPHDCSTAPRRCPHNSIAAARPPSVRLLRHEHTTLHWQAGSNAAAVTTTEAGWWWWWCGHDRRHDNNRVALCSTHHLCQQDTHTNIRHPRCNERCRGGRRCGCATHAETYKQAAVLLPSHARRCFSHTMRCISHTQIESTTMPCEPFVRTRPPIESTTTATLAPASKRTGAHLHHHHAWCSARPHRLHCNISCTAQQPIPQTHDTQTSPA
jgi:hypothetical protein